MATKKNSGKTAASTPVPRKKQETRTTKAAKAVKAAAAPDAAKPQKSELAKPQKPELAKPQKSEAAKPQKSELAKPARSEKLKKATTAVKAPLPTQEAERLPAAQPQLAGAGTVAAPPQPAPPSREEIAARAAAIWRETGGAPFDNWIRAERELGA